jgi:hypothetical protein
MASFFSFKAPSNEAKIQQTLSEAGEAGEEELKVLPSDSFFVKRLEKGEFVFDDVYAQSRTDNVTLGKKEGEDKSPNDMKKAKQARMQKVARGGHNKKADKKQEAVGNSFTWVERPWFNYVGKPYGEPLAMIAPTEQKIEHCLFFPPADPSKNNVLFGNAHFYSFLRHFHCLYERLIKARILAEKAFDSELAKKPELLTKYSVLLAKKQGEYKQERYENVYMKGLCVFLRGNIDVTKYEEFCRAALGGEAYLLFTVDKLVNSVNFGPYTA